MTTFDERERAYEKKFSLDQEVKFKAEARRNKLVAEWAAAKLSLSGPAISDYVKQVVKADLSDPGRGAYLKVKKDLGDKHVGVSDGELRRAMTEFLLAAVRQIEDAPLGQTRLR
jgi:hypothetical protein